MDKEVYKYLQVLLNKNKLVKGLIISLKFT